MSDFVQTMNDWRRMCMAMEKLHPDDSCCGCPLEGYGCPAIYEEDSSHVDYADVEKNVTAWAAEHPEHKYPTWIDWLVDQGLIFVTSNTYAFNFLKATDPIPANLAERIGLQPKEG